MRLRLSPELRRSCSLWRARRDRACEAKPMRVSCEAMASSSAVKSAGCPAAILAFRVTISSEIDEWPSSRLVTAVEDGREDIGLSSNFGDFVLNSGHNTSRPSSSRSSFCSIRVQRMRKENFIESSALLRIRGHELWLRNPDLPSALPARSVRCPQLGPRSQPSYGRRGPTPVGTRTSIGPAICAKFAEMRPNCVSVK